MYQLTTKYAFFYTFCLHICAFLMYLLICLSMYVCVCQSVCLTVCLPDSVCLSGYMLFLDLIVWEVWLLSKMAGMDRGWANAELSENAEGDECSAQQCFQMLKFCEAHISSVLFLFVMLSAEPFSASAECWAKVQQFRSISTFSTYC